MAMIADAAVRERALDPTRSFIVQAPAGSGKTDLLIKRYIALLPRVEKPEEILAITFTKKAAAEMKKRVIEALPDPAQVAHRIRIMTIDAFCALLTRQMPVVARFGAQPEIVQDADELYQDAAGRTIAALGPAVERLLAHLDNDIGVATALLATVLKRRDQWRRKTGAAPTRADLDAVLTSERNRLLARARALLPGAIKEPAGGLQEPAGGLQEPAGGLQELAAGLLTKNDRTWRKRDKRAQELAGNEPLREALSALLDMPPEKFNDAQWETLDAILGLVTPALVKLFEVFGERGQVDFTEIAHGALLALGEPDAPTDLLLSMDARVRHVLVDEFQDTSVSQWELLERLTAGWEAGDGRTVFAVGDPMQSVYRFRDAEVGLFLHARHAGLPNVALEPLALTTNFRSQAGIVDWVNGFFSRALPAQEDESTGAVSYAPSTAHHPALEGDAVTWHGFFDRADEAERVVEIVKNATGKVAILVRNRTHLDEIVPALKDAGLRFRAVEIEQLGERQVVQDLYALTRALSHPADRIAWLALLRAPWCGLGLNDLAQFFEGRGDRTVWEVMQEVPALQKIRAVLRPALEQRLRGTLRDSVEGVWLALGGPACVADATDLEDAEAFLDELERLEEAGALEDMAELEERLETKLYALPDVGAGVDAVEIMTIHKAKGLEFDTVIVPGLDRAPRGGDRPLFAWKALAEERVLLAPIDETGAGKDPIYRYVRELDREAEDIEAGRLLYVAATRAISRLHLLARARVDKNGEVGAPKKRSLLALAWFAAEEHFDPAEEHAPGAGGPVAPRADTIRRLAFDFVPPSVPALVAWQAPPEGRDASEEIEFTWAGETARHVGTVVHRWLQRIAEDELGGWDAKRVESLRPRFVTELERRGVQTREIHAAADLVASALKNTLADARGRWLLGSHPEAQSEYRMRTATRSLVVDRMLKDAQGNRWVVDYKTSRHEGANLEGFLDEQRKRYAPQLDAYAEALGGARRGLYFPLLVRWRDW